MAIYRSATRGVPVLLQDAASADEAPGLVIGIPDSFKNHQIIIQTSAGVASGAVQPEVADVPEYAGTWAPLGGGPITVPAASSEVVYNFTGVYKALRVRISTVIGGGTITVKYVGS